MNLKLRSKNILNCFPKRAAPTPLPDSENHIQWKDALGRFLWFNLTHLGAPFTAQIKKYQNEDFKIITRNNAKRKRGSNFHTKSVTAIWNSLTATRKSIHQFEIIFSKKFWVTHTLSILALQQLESKFLLNLVLKKLQLFSKSPYMNLNINT